MINAAIVGGTGYTGKELVRILCRHPEVNITSLTAKIDKSIPISDIFPEFKGIIDIECKPFDIKHKELIEQTDFVFLAVPHGVSLELVYKFLNQGKKVIDLSADYRLNTAKDYQFWYNRKHLHPELLEKAVYGLSEFNKEKIEKARLIANPGCFPTGILLSLLPVSEKEIIDFNTPIIIDSKTGTSGAGRKASLALSFSEVDQNIKPYKVNKHQHCIEIIQQIEKMSNKKVNIIFVPHLMSIKRGILNTIYVSLGKKIDFKKLQNYYLSCYKNSKFVKVFDSADKISLLDVVNTNKCHVGITLDKNGTNLIISSALDNLVKGAAGQAVQNMNIMCGLDESVGLV